MKKLLSSLVERPHAGNTFDDTLMASDVSSTVPGHPEAGSPLCKLDDRGENEEKCGGGVESKFCGVCGDKALGHNFNAITCESCKAFFRRNALRTKEFVCPFSNECKVDAITRRFCQRCRLKKCFDIGMKKEWIMTDEEKQMKKQKIEQNRKKRTSLEITANQRQTGRHNGRKNAKSVETEMVGRMSGPVIASVSSVIAPTPTDPKAEENSSNLAHSETWKPTPDSSTVHKQSLRLQNQTYDDITPPSVSSKEQSERNVADTMVPINSPNVTCLSSTPSPTTSHQSISPVPIQSSQPRPIQNGTETHFYNQQHHPHPPVAWTDGDSNSIPSPPITYGSTHMNPQYVHPHEPTSVLKYPPNKRPRIFDNYEDKYEDQSNKNPHSTPLLSYLIQPGHPESSPDHASSPPSQQPTKQVSNHQISRSEDNSFRHQAIHRPYEPLHNDGSEEYESSSRTPPSPQVVHSYRNGYSNRNEQIYADSHSIDPDVHKYPNSYNANSHQNDSSLARMPPIHTMDSILSIAIAAEFNSFGMMGGNPNNSKVLNKAEQAKLNELLLACQALHAPVDADRPIPKESDSSDTSLLNVINLTEIAIRRLIKMSKKISGFKNMCQEDQIALLKGGCTEMMILRSAVTYDPDRDSWQIPHSNPGYNINLGVLKAARGNLYEEHQRFNKSFRSEWRTNENIMIILCAITLFTPERPNVIHRDVVKLEQDSYYYLLKRYLESVMNGCEAKSNYLQLIRKIAELRALNSSHVRVFLEMNPKEVEPLLIEIFDLK